MSIEGTAGLWGLTDAEDAHIRLALDHSAEDFELVRLAINKARESGVVLDQSFIEETAAERLEATKTQYDFTSGGSPTLESSLQLVDFFLKGLIATEDKIAANRISIRRVG